MNTVDPRVFGRISEVSGKLQDLEREFEDQPLLYEVYSQPLQYEIALLSEQVREALAEADSRVDLWIGLNGAGFAACSGPVEVVANFLTGFRVAVKHSASALLHLAYTGGRFSREVESAAAFDLVALAPGSLRLGFASPAQDLPDDGLFEFEQLPEALASAESNRQLGIRALDTLLLALQAAESEDALARLRSELDDHGALRVLYHAGSLFPRGVTSIEFLGRALGEPHEFTTATRDRLRAIGETLVRTERYVAGVGVVRMLDLDRRSLRLEFARIESLPEVESIGGEYEPQVGPVSAVMGQAIAFSGWITFDTKGDPQRIKIDAIDLIESPQER